MSDPREKIFTHERQFPAPRRFISIRWGMVLVSVAGTKEGGGRVLAECARYESAFPSGDMMTTSLVRGPRPGPVGRLLRLLVIVRSSSDGWLMLTVSQPSCSCWDGADENSAYISKWCYALGHRMMLS